MSSLLALNQQLFFRSKYYHKLVIFLESKLHWSQYTHNFFFSFFHLGPSTCVYKKFHYSQQANWQRVRVTIILWTKQNSNWTVNSSQSYFFSLSIPGLSFHIRFGGIRKMQYCLCRSQSTGIKGSTQKLDSYQYLNKLPAEEGGKTGSIYMAAIEFLKGSIETYFSCISLPITGCPLAHCSLVNHHL